MRKRVRAHCLSGEGETDDIQRRLQKGNTDTGNIKIGLHTQELHAAMSIGRCNCSTQRCSCNEGGYRGLTEESAAKSTVVQERVCTLLALAEVMSYDNYWMNDNEDSFVYMLLRACLI